MNELKMNEELLLKVADSLENPTLGSRRFNMSMFIAIGEDDISVLEEDGDISPDDTLCRTCCCIAGEGVILARGGLTPDLAYELEKWGGNSWFCEGCKVFGLTGSQGQKLFFHSQWPTPFRQNYREAENEPERRKAGVSAIRDFVATNGWPELTGATP